MLTRLTGPSAVLLLSFAAIAPASAQPNKAGPAAAPAAAPAAPRAAAPPAAAARPAPSAPAAAASRAAPPAAAAPRAAPSHSAAPARSAPPPHVAAPQRAPAATPKAAAPSAARTRSTEPAVTQRSRAASDTPARASRAERAAKPTPGEAAQRPSPAAPDAQRAQEERARQQQEKDLGSQADRVAPARANELRAQGERLRQQQDKELRAQAGRVAPAQLNELRAQQRQQRDQLEAQQNQERQRALIGRVNQQTSGQTPRVATQVAARVAPEAARQGRFAAAFARAGGRSATALPNWTAWRLKRRAAFVAWSGALFWPYAYTDTFYYAFWPGAYDDGYWAYAYDDMLNGTYWAYGDPYAAYAYVGPNPETAGLTIGPTTGMTTGGRARDRGVTGRQDAPARQLAAACQQSADVANWPFAQIEAAIGPTPEQQQLLNNMKSAAAQAADMLRKSCPSSVPLTPPGRLQAMTVRLEATLAAVDLVRAPLAQFYDSLSDEQKARFNAIGPEPGRDGARVAQMSGTESAGACGDAKPGLIDLPIAQIEAVVAPTGVQIQALDRLRDASSRAVEALQSACPAVTPQTPTARLDAMHSRLAAMVEAAKFLQPALEGFYGSLSNEQKATFNTLGRDTQRPG